MKVTRVIPKSLAAFYLLNEFSGDAVEVTTVLLKDGNWGGEIIIKPAKEVCFTDTAEILEKYYQNADFYAKCL